jgi:hypothetical protein
VAALPNELPAGQWPPARPDQHLTKGRAWVAVSGDPLRPVVLNPSPIARAGGRVLIGSVAGCASEAILIETYDIAAKVCVIPKSVPGQ